MNPLGRPAFWWKTEENAAQLVFAYIEALQNDRKDLLELYVRNARLYDNRGDFMDDTIARRKVRVPTVVAENVIKSVVDTSMSKIAKNRPRATFQTDGATFSEQRRAKRLERYVEGMFEQLGVYRKAPLVFRDALLFGTGFLKITNDGKNVICERVLPEEIIVDETECRACPPLQMHQLKIVDREVVRAMFPDNDFWLDSSVGQINHDALSGWRGIESNQIYLLESWHPPTSEDSEDGVHMISVPNKVLLWEEYEDPDYPFEVFRWTDPIVGYYGISMVEELAGHQLQIHKMNKFTDRALDRVAVPRVYIHTSDLGMRARMDRTIGQLVPYKSKPPIVEVPRAVSGEHYQRLESLKSSAFEMTGVSKLSAQAKKQPGIEAAVAIRELVDQEAQRFAMQEIAYEYLHMGTAARIVKNSREVHMAGGAPATIWRSKNLAKKIQWSEVDLEDQVYTIHIEAASLLSRTPAGRMSDVTEMITSGLITDKDEARRLLGHPDLKRSEDLATAAIEDIEATIENLLDGTWDAPDPFQDLKRGVRMVQAAYNNARRAGAPEEILDMMRQWWQQARVLLEQSTAPPPMPAAAAGAAPGGPVPPEAVPLPGAPPGAPPGGAEMSPELMAALTGGAPPQV